MARALPGSGGLALRAATSAACLAACRAAHGAEPRVARRAPVCTFRVASTELDAGARVSTASLTAAPEVSIPDSLAAAGRRFLELAFFERVPSRRCLPPCAVLVSAVLRPELRVTTLVLDFTVLFGIFRGTPDTLFGSLCFTSVFVKGTALCHSDGASL